jgi:hypothetical protein
VNGREIKLGKCHNAIISTLTMFSDGCMAGRLTLMSRYRYTGSFRNCLSDLRTAGILEGDNDSLMKLTVHGMQHASANGLVKPLPQGEDLWSFWVNEFGKCHAAILWAMRKHGSMRGEELAPLCDPRYEYTGSFRNCLSDLRTAGVITGKNSDLISLSPVLLEAIDR